MHNPGLLPIERHAKLVEDLPLPEPGHSPPSARVRQVTTQSVSLTRVSRYPFCLISLSKGSKQDIAQQWRDDLSLRGSSWGLASLSLLLVARLQHLLNELQHSAVGNLLSDQGQEFFVIYGSEEVFEIRIDDPLVSGPHFTPDLTQGVGRLAAFTIPKATRIKDLFKDRFQID